MNIYPNDNAQGSESLTFWVSLAISTLQFIIFLFILSVFVCLPQSIIFFKYRTSKQSSQNKSWKIVLH